MLEPTCTDSSSSKVIVEQDNVSFTCTLDYVGNLLPNVTWYDCHGNEITNATNIFEQSFITSTILIPAYLPFVSTFKFETWMPDASNRLYTWNSTQIAVNEQSMKQCLSLVPHCLLNDQLCIETAKGTVATVAAPERLCMPACPCPCIPACPPCSSSWMFDVNKAVSAFSVT